METLGAASRQRFVYFAHPNHHVLTLPCSVGLPSINHLDADRVKREDMDYQRKHSAAAVPSPLHPHHPGPLHLHSTHQPSPASAVPASLGGLLSPPESRRTSGDERDPLRPSARQSLPSIHEALGSEQPLPYPATVPPPTALMSAPQHYLPPSATTSPADKRPRHFPPDLHASQGPSNPFSHSRSPFIGSSASQVPPPPPPAQTHAESLPRPPFSESRPSYSTPHHNPKLPSLHPLKTAQSPSTSAARPNVTYPSYPPQSAPYEAPTPQSAAPMNQHYSYPPHYPPSYPHSAPPASAPHSTYPPSASTYSAPPRYPPPAWRDTNAEMAHLEEKKIGRSSLAPYGESVKRHLESFDLEASLNEVSF